MSRLDFVTENKEISQEELNKIAEGKDKRENKELKKVIKQLQGQMALIMEQLTAMSNRLMTLENNRSGLYQSNIYQPIGQGQLGGTITWPAPNTDGISVQGGDTYTLNNITNGYLNTSSSTGNNVPYTLTTTALNTSDNPVFYGTIIGNATGSNLSLSLNH